METSLNAMIGVGGRAVAPIVAETVFPAILVPAIMVAVPLCRERLP